MTRCIVYNIDLYIDIDINRKWTLIELNILVEHKKENKTSNVKILHSFRYVRYVTENYRRRMSFILFEKIIIVWAYRTLNELEWQVLNMQLIDSYSMISIVKYFNKMSMFIKMVSYCQTAMISVRTFSIWSVSNQTDRRVERILKDNQSSIDVLCIMHHR